MKPRAARALVAVLAGCAGCAGVDAMPAPPPAAAVSAHERQLGLYPGEAMAFQVQLGGVLVGEAQLAVGELGEVDGRSAIVVRSRAATAGAVALVRNIVDEATTVIDADTGRPLSVETNA